MTEVDATPDEYTWLTIIPPDDQEADVDQWITRAELLAEYPAVSDRVLKSWESKGVLPRPLIRWKDGRPYTWYPPFLASSAVHVLRNLKKQGYSLSRIAPIIEDHIEAMIFFGKPKAPTPKAQWNAALHEIGAQLESLSDTYREVTGHGIDWFDLKITDDEGETVTLKYPSFFGVVGWGKRCE